MIRKALLYTGLIVSTLLYTSCIQASHDRVMGQAGVYIGNLHTHTTGSDDGKNTYREMVDEAIRLGYDFLVITDHHSISLDTRFRCANEKDILCVIGEEISTDEVHILAIDIKNAIPYGTSAQETIDRIHAQGGIAIAAHLNDPKYGTDWTYLDQLKDIDAYEYTPILGQEWYDAILFRQGTPVVFDSDAHSTEALKNVANSCTLEELSIEGLKQAIKKGMCTVYFP